MAITLDLSPHTQQRLEAMAAKRGKPLTMYINELIERTVLEDEDLEDNAPIDVILAPFRAGFANSGMTEEEATDLLDAQLKAVRAERRAMRPI